MEEDQIKDNPIVEPKKKNPNTVFGILCLIGTCIICFVFPSLFSFHTFAIYQTSYIKHNGGDASVIYTIFYYPVTLFIQSIMGLFAGMIFAKVGVHWSNLIGSVIYILAAIIMYISTRFYLDMISSVLYGIACAILAFPSSINTCKYFMNRVGLINGIIATIQSVGTTVFTYLGEQMINPDNIPSDPVDHLYNKDIASRVKYFLLLQIFCVLGAYIICEMITKTYDENNKEEFGLKFLFKINEIKSLCKKKKEEKLLIIAKSRKEKIKMVLKSWKFSRYDIICITSSLISNIIFSMYRSLGETYQIDQNALQLLGILNSIIGFIFSFIIGVLCDYVNFKVLLFINNMLGAIVGILYYHSFQDTLSFCILTLIISIQSSGYFCINEYHLIKTFGLDILVDLSGVISLTTGICIILLTIFTYLIEISIAEKDLVYLIRPSTPSTEA